MQVGDLVLNKYIVTSIVSGDGTNRRGMSNLYKAKDKDLGIYWAIKEIIKNSDGTISIQQKSLIREAQIMRKLQHPSIPRIVSIEQLEDRVLIVMDWVDGRSVGEWIRSSGAIGVQRGLSIIKNVCNVLSYLHNRPVPIFYRDMKPENIMYDLNTKRVMLLDFGISEEVTPGKEIKDRLGTRGYYDPLSLALTRKEKAEGMKPRTFDLRSDIYSLGWTMFNMFSGANPLSYQQGKKDKGLEITRDIREYSKGISPALASIIIKATEPDPDDRFQSVEELIIALEEIEKVDSGATKKLKRRVNTVIGVGAIGFLLSVGSLTPYMAYERGLAYEYQTLVANATKSGSFEDYVKVLEYDSSSIDPYFGLLDATKEDGVLSKDEESTMLDLINPNLPMIEKDDRYKELAFEVGRLYWLYYDGDNSEELASRWFKDASGYNQLADVFYHIGSFPMAVVKSANEGSDAGMYKKQWNTLNSVTGQSELVTLQISKAKLYLVDTYTNRLKSDGVSKEEVLAGLDSITEVVNSIPEDESRQSQIAKELKEALPSVKEKVEVAYSV